MKIAFVASLKNYTTAISLIRAFEKLGHELLIFSDMENQYVENIEIVERDFDIARALISHRFDADFMFFCEGGSMKLFPRGIEDLKCLTSWYAIDTHMDLDKHLIISDFFDVTFIAQKQYINQFKQRGNTQTHWLPLAFDDSFSFSNENDRTVSFAHVGSMNKAMHPERFELLSQLQINFQNVDFRSANAQEMYDLYSRSKIVFNKSINNDINMRCFEALGSGAILLTDKITDNGMDELFTKGIHYFEYTSKSLIDTAQIALDANIDHSSLRSFIYKEHLYVNRALDVVNILGSVAKHWFVADTSKYLSVYVRLENLSASLDCIRKITHALPVKHSWKVKLILLPVTFTSHLVSVILHKLRH